MTSEVALLNRSAVALAADSAATVSYWNPDTSKHEERYFKRVNKIFNIVSGQPVGMMCYAAGSLQGMPWEVVAKAYRNDQRGTVFDKLPEYAADLFAYLERNRDIFPEAGQHEHFMALVSETAMTVSTKFIFEDAYTNELDPIQKAALAEPHIASAEAAIRPREYINDVARQIHDELIAGQRAIIDEFSASDDGVFLLGHITAPLLERILLIAIERVFKQRVTQLDQSGIVVAGYGAKQYMPQLEQFNVYGLFKNRLIFTRQDKGCCEITYTNNSEIVPIAQSRMVNTFRLGADFDTLGEIDSYVGIAIDEFTAALRAAGHLPAGANTDSMKTQATEAFTGRVREYIWKTHGRPFKRVIGMLSPEELAELAETFVSAESLKERVTKPTETVSGPVDVALISKSDGFIWIKRKHYFDPALNLRFVAQRQQEVQ